MGATNRLYYAAFFFMVAAAANGDNTLQKIKENGSKGRGKVNLSR